MPFSMASTSSIIPYQELLGNYDSSVGRESMTLIIPYQELLGNYDQAVPLLYL